MTAAARIARRLRGLGFLPDGNNRWVRGHVFCVMLGNDGLSVFVVKQEYRRGRGSKCYHSLKSVDVERLIAPGLSLDDTVAVIERELQNARRRGQMNGWWHEKKERS